MAIEVLYPACARINVHRNSLVVMVSRAVGRREKRETRTFGAVTEEARTLVQWLDEQEVPIVAMESTGVDWKPAYRAIRTLSPEAHRVAGQSGAHQRWGPREPS